MSRTISAAMQTLLQGDSVPSLPTFVLIVRTDGEMFGFTDWTNDIKSGGITYFSSPGASRSAIQQRVDLAVPSTEITSILESDAVTDEDIRAGKYNGATVKVFNAVATDTDFLTYGTIRQPGAFLGEIKIQDGIYIAELRGLSYALTQSFIEVFTPTCRADFCDARCALNIADFTVTGTIALTTTDQIHFGPSVMPVLAPNGSGPTSFKFGLCTFTSGPNMGFAVEIQDWVPTGSAGPVITLYLPTPYPMTVGDTISVSSGCDKTVGACRDAFSNIGKMRAEPFIPGANFLFDYGVAAP